MFCIFHRSVVLHIFIHMNWDNILIILLKKPQLFAGRENTDDVWIGGSGGTGEYDCAHQTALYNTRN